MPIPPDNCLKCSFCGKTQDKVKKLIAGPGVYVCNECVNLCADIIEDEELESVQKWKELSSGAPIELSAARRPDVLSEELQILGSDALKAIQPLRKYHQDASTSRGGVEFILRTILYLRTLEIGRNSEELLPLLSELSAIYSADGEFSTAAETTEWAHRFSKVTKLPSPQNAQ